MVEIREDVVVVRTPDGPIDVANDFVLAMTGYQPDFTFLASLGITFADDGFRTPIFDEATFESARPGLFLAGTVCGGLKTNRWFIENGRFHAQQIVKHLAGQRTEAIPLRRSIGKPKVMPATNAGPER